eukprot:5311380-Karenia_brevis.AAC.1
MPSKIHHRSDNPTPRGLAVSHLGDDGAGLVHLNGHRSLQLPQLVSTLKGRTDAYAVKAMEIAAAEP